MLMCWQVREEILFVADGESKDYYLDTTMLEQEGTVKAWINDVETNNFSVDRSLGKISFVTAPEAPLTTGQDNVVIEFEKIGTDYPNRILKCTKSLVLIIEYFYR